MNSAAQPQVGGVYAVPLKNGKYGAIRVIESNVGHCFIVIDGLWNSVPSSENLLNCLPMQKIDPVNRPGQVDRLDLIFKGWFKEALPSKFTLILTAPLTPDEQRLCRPEGTTVFQSPKHFADYLYQQLCKRYDREAYDVELEQQRQKHESVNQSRAKNAEERKDGLTLARFASEKPFAHWSKMWPERAVSQARAIFREAALELIALGKNFGKDERHAVFKRVVDRFNKLEQDEGCIETEEREEVIARIEELAALVGLDNKDEQLTGDRDW